MVNFKAKWENGEWEDGEMGNGKMGINHRNTIVHTAIV
jgi:hypothetical protein